MEKFPNFLHNGEQIFHPRSYGKKIIWSTLFKFLKDTISKTNRVFDNTMTFLTKTFQRERFRKKWLKHKNHSTWQNSWSYVTIRELQARKHNQFSVTKRLLRKDKNQKTGTFHDI
jgi:hypothetical protein